MVDERQLRWYSENLPLARAVVVDVGANVGTLSEFFWQEGAEQVLSVEPVPENVVSLRARIPADARGRWGVFEGAVSAGEARLSLRRELHGKAWNSVVDPNGGLRATARTLPELCAAPTLVKMDIEGYEHAVLAQAVSRMPTVRAWALELHSVPGIPLPRTLGVLKAAGFSLHAAGRRPDDPTGPWICAPISASLVWDRIPVAATRPDGTSFRMLHVLARRG